MIFAGTILQVCDNSGVKFVKCLKVLNNRPKSCGKIGDFIIVNIQSIKTFSKIKRKEIYKAIIVRLKFKINRIDGSYITFTKNSVILLNNKNLPIGTRIFGPICKELRIKKNLKLISLCSKIL
jgi:large subunit ribosomal protein L14